MSQDISQILSTSCRGPLPPKEGSKKPLSRRTKFLPRILGKDLASTNETLFNRQQSLRIGCWRIVTVENDPYLASIEVIKEKTLTVKILDSRVPVNSWLKIEVTPEQLSPTLISTSKTLDELIINLKRTKILHSRSVENALRFLDRKYFCPKTPYHDCAVTIGDAQYGVCISSPHIHVWAAELLKEHLGPNKNCLDVGSGSGYFTALLQCLSKESHVYGIEYYLELIKQSQTTLQTYFSELFKQITFVEGDGEKGLPTKGPFHAIHVGFMCQTIPPALMDQLAVGGRMVIPVSNGKPSAYDTRCISGTYTCVDKDLDGKVHITELFTCSFVPSISSVST